MEMAKSKCGGCPGKKRKERKKPGKWEMWKCGMWWVSRKKEKTSGATGWCIATLTATLRKRPLFH